MKPLLKPQTICKKSKIPYYGVVNVVKIWDFENHPKRVFLIHVFYRILKLFVVYVFRLPSGGVWAQVFFYLSNFYPWNHSRSAPKLLIFSDLNYQMHTSSLKLWFFEPQFFSFGTLNEGFFETKKWIIKKKSLFFGFMIWFHKKLNINYYDDFLKGKFYHVDHGRSNTVVWWFWYLPDFFVLSTGFNINNFFFSWNQ